MRVCWSTSDSVYHNLALEEWWVDHLDREGPVLLFYVNAPSIVVGKNQNPWREAATEWARQEGVPVARRISGGGTVYHDPGNLNFSLILPRGTYRQETVFSQTCAALSSLGVEARVTAGNSITCEEKKISGTAFCFRGPAALHHGTLLVNADLERLRRSMRPALTGVVTRAIASKPAAVGNVRDIRREVRVEDVASAVATQFVGRPTRESFAGPDDEAYRALLARHQSWEWIWGHTPVFEWTLELADGSVRVHVENGIITRAIRSWCRDREEAVATLSGARFDPAETVAFFQ